MQGFVRFELTEAMRPDRSSIEAHHDALRESSRAPGDFSVYRRK